MMIRFELEVSIARARIVLSLATLVSVYLDPAIGGLFRIGASVLSTLFVHLGYGLVVYAAIRRRPGNGYLAWLSAALDVSFAVLLALFTEGHTSPAFAFFAFAIIAVGCRAGFRATIFVTFSSMLLYFALILFLSPEMRDFYVMRPAYLAVTGYLIGFLGQQRAKFEAQVAERQHIARFLHDGYAQGLAGVQLRLESAREFLRRSRPDETERELAELQTEVAREFDDVRAYIRTLAEVDREETSHATFSAAREPDVRVQADFTASGRIVEQVLQVMLEGTRNTRRHANARSSALRAVTNGASVRITIDDDGVGFAPETPPPWSIASRVAELGGRCAVVEDGRPGAHFEVEMPSR